MTQWTAIIDENEDGELILPIPQELLDLQGWKEGDDLEWTDNGDGTWSLSKVNE
jgi:hypothetical protein